MGVVLARVDQRLIHGIVVNQWAPKVNAKRLMVIDEIVSQDETQKAAMRMSKPSGTGMSIINLETAINNFKQGKYDSHNVFLIVKEPDILVKLVEEGIEIPKVHIGILFDEPGKKEIKKMVSLNEQEINDFKKLEEMGVKVTFQYVPTDEEEPMSKYI